MTSANVEQAADLNNYAVLYLESGNLAAAIQLFRDALKAAMQDLGKPSPSSVQQGSQHHYYRHHLLPPDNDSRPKLADMLMPVRKVCLEPNISFLNHTSRTASAAPFIHSQAVELVSSPGAYSPDVVINTTIFSAIIITNLALVYHIKALETSELRQTRLMKAQSLYEKSYRLLAGAGVIRQGSTSHPVVDLVVMALLNNLALVTFESQNYGSARAAFGSLTNYALTVTPTFYQDATIMAIMEQCKLNFLLNSIVLHAPQLAAAA